MICHSAASTSVPPSGASPQMERCSASPQVPALQRTNNSGSAMLGQLQAERLEHDRAALARETDRSPARTGSPDRDRPTNEGWVRLRKNFVVDEIRRLQQELDMLERVVHRARHATAVC